MNLLNLKLNLKASKIAATKATATTATKPAKHSLAIIAVAAISLLTSACAKKEQGSLAKSSRATRSSYSTTTNGVPFVGSICANGKTCGAMTQGNLSAQEFQSSVQMFASASIAPEQIGTVSGNAYGNTGIRFFGDIRSTSPVTTAGGYAQITGNSRMYIGIWDSFAGQMDPNSGQRIPEYGVDYSNFVHGQVYGTYAEIYFENYVGGVNYGSVTLRGDIKGATFTGYVSFENSRYWDGASPGAAGDNVWAFSIPTCSFFNCQ